MYFSDKNNSKDDASVSSITKGKKDRTYDIQFQFENILKITAETFPHAKVYLYGSRAYQLGDDKNSDVNIYVDLGKINRAAHNTF